MEPIYVQLREYVNPRELEDILVKAAEEMGWKATITPSRDTVYSFLDGRVVRKERFKHNTIFITSKDLSRKVEFEIKIMKGKTRSELSIISKNIYTFPSEEEIKRYLSFVYRKELP